MKMIMKMNILAFQMDPRKCDDFDYISGSYEGHIPE
jgi:hypothetical protein